MSEDKLKVNVTHEMFGEFKDDESKNILLKALKTQVVRVSFEKTDGTMRDMNCTLMESKIPDDKKPKTENSKQNPTVLPVFDVEKDAWRSFRWDSIRNVAFDV